MGRFFILALILVSCSPASKEEWCIEGGNIANELARDLSTVESLDDLEDLSPRLKKKFYKLVDLMIAAKKYRIKHPEEGEGDVISLPNYEKLKGELIRVYQIEGCSSHIEELERDSLHKLDQFSRRLQKWES